MADTTASANASSAAHSYAAEQLRSEIVRHLMLTVGAGTDTATLTDWRIALSHAVRDRVTPTWLESQRHIKSQGNKQVYYLSMEFLIGRLLEDTCINVGIRDAAVAALATLGVDFDDVVRDEPDAALGNGGLGRLAACYLESMSTLGCPATGYGIRYEHGLFKQSFEDGRQTELPEDWLGHGSVWDVERSAHRHLIGFGGGVEDVDGAPVWNPGTTIIAEAHDIAIVGWQGNWANTLRLWAATSPTVLDLERFNRGDYLGASEPEISARALSRVLYPDDSSDAGKELRLKQEYFFTAAALADILGGFLTTHDDLRRLPESVAIQMNDTHPAIAGPELLRIFVDEHGFEFDEAVEIVTNTLSYTNHTLLPEALEQWPTELMARVLPRHLQLIEQLDQWHHSQFPERAESVGLLAYGNVSMGNLAFVLSHHTNGVSALHSELVRKELFSELDSLHPGRIVNETNGIAPRRWIKLANPSLAELITDAIGTGWEADLDRLAELEPLADDPEFRGAFGRTKNANKIRMAARLSQDGCPKLNTAALFDVQAKRIHEYKRQLMNILHTIAHWSRIKAEPNADWVPRVKIFAGKSAPGYAMAKDIIRLINDVAAVINDDPQTRDLLTVIYPPNYNVSMAETLIPAADLSEQISTAGMEASGTGNMKFTLNGALTIGTLDGANVEIRERVGAEHFFLFGMNTAEVSARRAEHAHAQAAIDASPALQSVIELIGEGRFSPGEPGRYCGLLDSLKQHDYFLVASDFDSYDETQSRVDERFVHPDHWQRDAILNVSRSGFFSSDRAIRGYMSDIWSTSSALGGA